MIPTVQFDSGTLTIWTTTGTLASPVREFADAVFDAAHRNDNVTEALRSLASDDPLRDQLLWLASSVWHEKRHFLDAILTNYGARRFRDMFGLAANALPLFAYARARGEPVWLPVETYANRIRRALFGIAEPPANVLAIATQARDLKKFLADLDAPARSVGGHGPAIEVGAEAQLEGLAQASQSFAIEYFLGTEACVAFAKGYVHSHAPESAYRSIEAISGIFGCEAQRGEIRVLNPGLASALYFAALCPRMYGLGRMPSAALVSPWERLARFIHELGPRTGRFEMSDEEAAARVEGLTRRLYGRTPFEEINADIDAMDGRVTAESAPWLNQTGLLEVWTDYIALRRRCLKLAMDAGFASVLPRAFPISWLPRLRPWRVECTPGGTGRKIDEPVVFGYELHLPKKLAPVSTTAVWGRLHATEGSAEFVAVRDRTAWIKMLQQHGPVAQLMLNGRRGRKMLPPELEGTLAQLKDCGLAVQFDSQYEYPATRDMPARIADAQALATFAGRQTFNCDLTGDKITRSQAAVLTPWEFRRSVLCDRYLNEAGLVGQIQLALDWSDWIVRKDLLESVEVSSSWAER